jgi:hypothetical protein
LKTKKFEVKIIFGEIVFKDSFAAVLLVSWNFLTRALEGAKTRRARDAVGGGRNFRARQKGRRI